MPKFFVLFTKIQSVRKTKEQWMVDLLWNMALKFYFDWVLKKVQNQVSYLQKVSV